MPCFASSPPPADVPVLSGAQALAIARAAITVPLRPELVVLLLDCRRRGHTIVAFAAGESYVASVGQLLADTAGESGTSPRPSPVRQVVYVAVRPGGGPRDDDQRRWRRSDQLLAGAGVTLLDYLVLGRDGAFSIPWTVAGDSRW